MPTNFGGWSNQAATGASRVAKSKHIADDICDFSDTDIFCLQDALRTINDNHVHDIASLFSNHEMFFGTAVNRARPSSQMEFRSLILTRLPLQAVN